MVASAAAVLEAVAMAAVIALEVVPPVVAVLVAAGSTRINTFLNFTFIKE